MPRPTSLPTGPLSGGVSQQAAEHRLPGQVSAATNFDFTVDKGLVSRNGATYLRKITGLTAGGNYRLHDIRRDGNEEYAVVYGMVSTTLTIKIVRLSDGELVSPTIDSDAQAYLNLAASSADLRFRTIADTTMILNTAVTPAQETSPSYSVTLSHRDSQTMQSRVPAAATYHRAVNDDELAPAGFWLYGSPQFAYRQFANVAAAWDTATEFQTVTQNPCGFKVFIRRRDLSQSSCTYTHASKRITYATPLLADYVVTGEEVFVTAGTTITAGYYVVAAHTTTYVEFTVAPGTANNTDTTINGLGKQYEVVADFTRDVPADHDDIALTLQRRLREAGAVTACINWTKNTTTGYFTIVGEYDSAEGSVSQPTAPTSAFDLSAATRPFNSTGTSTGGGASVSGADPTRTQIEDRWTRVAAPIQKSARIDRDTMPVKLVRTDDDPLTFTASVITWDDRLSGDHATNPPPTVLTAGDTLADLIMFKDRLFVAGAENLAGTVGGDIFNWFNQDFDNLTDSDPVGVTLGSDQFTAVDYLMVLEDAIVIITKAGRQFELTSSDGALTPATVQIQQTTTILTHVGVRPALMGGEGGTILLIGPDGGYSSVYRYGFNPNSDRSGAVSITQHVSKFLPSTIKTISASPTKDIAIVVPTAGDALYVYRAYSDGESVRQASWTTYTFTGTLLDAKMIGTKAVLLFERASQHILETLELADEAPPSGLTFAPRIDTKFTATGVFGGVNTTWTIPNSMSDATINRVVLGSAFGANTGREVTVTSSATTVTAAGVDWSAGSATLGRSFTPSATLSRPMRRNQDGLGRTQERVHVEWAWVDYVNSGPFSMTVAQSNRTDRTRTLVISGYGISTGEEQMRVGGDASAATWTIAGTSARPVQIAGINWAVTIGLRSK